MIFQGSVLRVSLFGQSHAPAVGAVIDGLPAGFRPDPEQLRAFMARRAPGGSPLVTGRKEADLPEFLSGLPDGVTCGAPVALMIRNTDVRSGDYGAFRDIPRPSHADWPALRRYGPACDLRGGGPFSARLTAPLCAAGGIALQLLASRGVRIGAHLASVGEVEDIRFDPVSVSAEDLERAAAARPLPVLDPGAGERMRALIEQVRGEEDSVGGCVECAALGLPAGVGGPLFEGLESSLAAALFAVPAVRGVSFGDGFEAAAMRGSAHNDPYAVRDRRVTPASNHAGGLVGGITTGMPLIVRAALKPTPSIGRAQQSVSLSRMEPAELKIKGRHDPCVAVRAVPVVEAVCALALLDRLMAETRLFPRAFDEPEERSAAHEP